MAEIAYIQFTSRLKATSQEGVIAEAQQIAVSASDNTDIKTYVDNKVSGVAGSVYRPKGSITAANLKALTSAAVGDVYNVTDALTLGSKSYPAGTNVACVKAFSTAVTPSETYWDALAGFVDLSPYAKSSDLSSNVSALETKISAAQSTASEAKTQADTNKSNITSLTTTVGNKVDKVSGKGLSTNDFTAAYKTKLDGLSNYTLPTASSTVLGGVKVGTNLSIANGVLSAKDTTYSAATSSVNGLMSSTDKAKLDSITVNDLVLFSDLADSDGEVYDYVARQSDVTSVNDKLKDAVLYKIEGGSNSETGGLKLYFTGLYTTLGSGLDRVNGAGTAYEYGALQILLTNATSTENGMMSSTDKAKLDGINTAKVITSGAYSSGSSGAEIYLKNASGIIVSTITIPYASASSGGVLDVVTYKKITTAESDITTLKSANEALTKRVAALETLLKLA